MVVSAYCVPALAGDAQDYDGAGHETTATALAFAFELLLRNQPVLARLREELEGGEDDFYLDAVVKETLRLRPVINAAERTLTVPRTVAGWELPAGVKVYPAITLVHLREDLYPRAQEFRPERFIEDGAESYSWLPFGGGIRRCIGAALAHAEVAEVLRVAVPAVELRPLREEPDPVVLRGISCAGSRSHPSMACRSWCSVARSYPAGWSLRPFSSRDDTRTGRLSVWLRQHQRLLGVIASLLEGCCTKTSDRPGRRLSAGAGTGPERSAGMSRSTHSPDAAVSPATSAIAPL